MLSRLSSLMIRRTPRSTRTDTLVPYTTLFRSNVIYAHEVLGMATLQDRYQRAAPDVLLASTRDSEIIRAPKNGYPKYCLKMATGTGKTWVLQARSEEHTSELQSLMRISYAVFCLKKKKTYKKTK